MCFKYGRCYVTQARVYIKRQSLQRLSLLNISSARSSHIGAAIIATIFSGFRAKWQKNCVQP